MNWRTTLPILIAGIAILPGAFAQSDRAFDAVPFDQWVAAGERTQIKWAVRVFPPLLATTQRLVARVEIQVDGDEAKKRRGRGALVMLVQIVDAKGRLYRAHNVVDLREMKEEASRVNFVYSQDVFVLPGQYRITVAAFDSENLEYSLTQRTLRAHPIKKDPLPRTWQDLPDVELARGLPGGAQGSLVRGGLHLPMESRRPIHLQVLLNTSPSLVSPTFRGRQIPQGAILGRILGALRVLGQLRPENGTFDVTLLDLIRRKVIYEQDGLRPLNWAGISEALNEADPKIIDATSLRNRGKSARFFVEQVRKRITPAEAAQDATAEPAKVLIILTGPMAFPKGEDLSPIEGGTASNNKVYLIRQYALLRRVSRMDGMDPPVIRMRNVFEDQLGGTIRPVNPRVLDVFTPEDFRNALAHILDDARKL